MLRLLNVAAAVFLCACAFPPGVPLADEARTFRFSHVGDASRAIQVDLNNNYLIIDDVRYDLTDCSTDMLHCLIASNGWRLAVPRSCEDWEIPENLLEASDIVGFRSFGADFILMDQSDYSVFYFYSMEAGIISIVSDSGGRYPSLSPLNLIAQHSDELKYNISSEREFFVCER